MQINSNTAFSRQKTVQQNFNGFFKISDPRIKTFFKDGDICTNEFGTKIVKNWENKFSSENYDAFLTISKPMYIICKKFYDLPVMIWLKEQGIRYTAKELPEIDTMFNKNFEEWENIFKKIPQRINEKIFLN